MPDKVKSPSPEVSQLAGKIARELFDAEWLVATENGLPDVAKLISSCVSQREAELRINMLEAVKRIVRHPESCSAFMERPGYHCTCGLNEEISAALQEME